MNYCVVATQPHVFQSIQAVVPPSLFHVYYVTFVCYAEKPRGNTVTYPPLVQSGPVRVQVQELLQVDTPACVHARRKAAAASNLAHIAGAPRRLELSVWPADLRSGFSISAIATPHGLLFLGR